MSHPSGTFSASSTTVNGPRSLVFCKEVLRPCGRIDRSTCESLHLFYSPSYMAWWSKHPLSGDYPFPWRMWRLISSVARNCGVLRKGDAIRGRTSMGRIRHNGSRLEPREKAQASDECLYRLDPRHISSTYLFFLSFLPQLHAE